MKAIVLVIPRGNGGDGRWPFDLLGHFGRPHSTDPSRSVVSLAREDWIAVVRDQDLADGYDLETLAGARAALGDEAAFYLIEARTSAPLRRYVTLPPEAVPVLIDNGGARATLTPRRAAAAA